MRVRAPLLGFTLVEILIALVILAIALAATGRATNLSIDTAREVRIKTLAQWVAQNRAAELQAAPQWPSPGESRASVPMAELSFELRQSVSETANAAFRRVAIDVRADGQPGVQATLVTYIARIPRAAP
jgi:general secretion pathway protein I